MKSGWRILIAAAAVFQAAGGTALAQNAVTPAPATNATDVGPPQLRDFTLNGTVTRPAETQAPRPAPSTPAPAAQPPGNQPSSTTALPPARRPEAASAPTPAPAPAPGAVTVALPPPSVSAAQPPAGGSLVEAPPLDEPAASFAPDASAMPDSPSILPWLLAALLLGAGAAYYFLRIRPRTQLADGPGASQFTSSEPARPEPPAPAPAPVQRPKPAPPAGGGIVSTSLRPWIEVDFIPERTVVDAETIAIEFMVALYNSGSAPARDVLIEAAMFNASPAQDQQIGAFFAQPAGRGERVEMVAPLQRAVVRTTVTVPRSQIRPLLAEGRPLLVPMTALTVVYRWGSNNHGQTSASYLVGKETSGDKLAPFRLDLGPRVFRGLAAREHQLRVRR